MAAEVGALDAADGRHRLARRWRLSAPAVGFDAAVADPVKVRTLALGGVMEMRLFSANGQSTAELSTEARRSTPAV